MTGNGRTTWRACAGVAASSVALGPDRRAERGDQLLADRVERRVGHLREQLGEVVEEQPGPRRTAPRSGVSVPIEPSASPPVRAIGVEQDLAAPPGCSRRSAGAGPPRRRCARCARARAGRRGGSARRAATRRTGAGAASSALISSSSTIRPCSVSTRNIRPGWSRPLRTTRRRVEVEDAGLGGEDDQAVVGDPVAAGAQAVAVEDRADRACRR